MRVPERFDAHLAPLSTTLATHSGVSGMDLIPFAIITPIFQTLSKHS